MIALKIDLFTDADRFKSEMDVYVRKVRDLKPLVGFDEALLPGAIENRRWTEYSETGIPVGEWHRGRLEKLAEELSIGLPW